MNYHKKPETEEELKQWENMLLDQGRDAIGIKGTIKCICGKDIHVFNIFRCYYCGLYLCPACSQIHFGERPEGERTKQARGKE